MKLFVTRCDAIIGRNRSVSAHLLFPPLRSFTPGLKRVPAEDQQLTQLYTEMSQLLPNHDATTPGSPTAKRLQEIDRQLTEIERAQADELEATIEAQLLLPPNAGAEAARVFDELIARYATPTSHTAIDDSPT